MVVAVSAAGQPTTADALRQPWRPPACSGADSWAAESTGTWWRLDPDLVGGRLVGQRLTLGGPGRGTRVMALGAESFAAGPFGGRVLVGTDDGDRSVLSLVDLGRGCAEPIGESGDVIRRATATPDHAAIVEHRVDRLSRQDLGVFRRPLDGTTEPTTLLGPIGTDDRFGPTWTTEFSWSLDGRELAVQSCAAVACRTRLVDLIDGTTVELADPMHGDLVGVAAGRLILHQACAGLPCPLLSIDLETGETVMLEEAAGQAVLVVDGDGHPVVVHEVDDGSALWSSDPTGRVRRPLAVDLAGRRLVAGPARTGGAMEGGADRIVLGPDGRLPAGGSVTPIIQRLADGASGSLVEVSR